MSSMYRSWAEIDLRALNFNLKRIQSLNHPSCQTLAVVKANAYGHSVSLIVPALITAGIRHFAVANLTEAEEILKLTPEPVDVLILGPLHPGELHSKLPFQRLILTLSNEEELNHWKVFLKGRKTTIRTHLKVDTGMGRVGAFPHEVQALFQKAWNLPKIRLEGLYSHMATADSDPKTARRQLDDFLEIHQALALPHSHIQNSAGTLLFEQQSVGSLARAGIALYGIPCPEDAWKRKFGTHPLCPVLSWKTRIIQIRNMPAGKTISYDRTFRVQRPTRTALLSVGYADGLFRKLSNRGKVLIKGQFCKILGRVTMDMIIVDITTVPTAQWGDEAVLIGHQGRHRISAQEMADLAETIPYEITCHISQRVPRIPSAS